MTTWAVIATGESLKPDPAAIAAKVRHLPCVAVCDAYAIAPWARALVAADAGWWLKHHRAAAAFVGEKWANTSTSLAMRLLPRPFVFTNTNSALLGALYAIDRGATRLLLLGVDMRGSHYFGAHPSGLGNTDSEKFALFIRQWQSFAERMPEWTRGRRVGVVNCSTISALDCFPKLPIEDALELELVC